MPPSKPLVLASSNAGKLAELRALLAHLTVEVRAAREMLEETFDVEEDGRTFDENAVKKARAAAAVTGLPSLADDSGLEVDALDGAPGVRSARYAGERASASDNNDALLEALRGVPLAQRRARFRCVVALAIPGRDEVLTASGSCEGAILEEPRGQEGFGYDPLFVPFEQDGRTMAELSREEKNAISHRGRALRKLLPDLERLLG